MVVSFIYGLNLTNQPASSRRACLSSKETAVAVRLATQALSLPSFLNPFSPGPEYSFLFLFFLFIYLLLARVLYLDRTSTWNVNQNRMLVFVELAVPLSMMIFSCVHFPNSKIILCYLQLKNKTLLCFTIFIYDQFILD